MPTSAAPLLSPAPAGHPVIDLSKLPPGAMFMRILGVNYVRLRTEDEGDLYLTEHGVPFWRQLQPTNWYETQWFESHRTRLEGTGTVYHLPTRPLEAKSPTSSIDLVVKWSRVGEDVPLDTFTLAQAVNAEFNTPFEEFSLLESLRSGEYGPRSLAIHTQKPLAIYVPPQRLQLWQTGRSKAKILSKIGRHPSVEIDILRSYIMLYGWIDGPNAVDAFKSIHPDLAQMHKELKDFTRQVDADLHAKGFLVADHKPTHVIVRMADNQLRRRRDGKVAYGIVDYELLARTAEYDQAVGAASRSEYFVRQRDRFLPRPASSFPAHLKPANLLGVDYVYGSSESTHGQLWVVGNDPELFNYFLPERWRHKQVLMSPWNQTYYVQTKDKIHLLWKISSVGELSVGDDADPRCQALRRHGYNSPFEEFAYAIEMGRKGIRTVHPRAIYVTGKYGGLPGCVGDARRFEAMGQCVAPDGAPVMPFDQDFVVIWGYWRGLDDVEGCSTIFRPWTPIDAAQAARAGMIPQADLDNILDRQKNILAAGGYVDHHLRGENVLLSYIPEGSFKTDETGQLELRHCNFEFIGRV